MTLRTKREHLRELVADKNRWSDLKLTDAERSLGFLGWHERGYLPHCDFPGLIQFVTFRLVDSMPASRRGEWEHLLAIDDSREKRTKLEEYLDRGIGDCWLRQPRIATLCEEALRYFHNKRYELRAWCVMPNHVHVLVQVWEMPLGKMVQSWKRYVATEAEAILAERRSPTRRVSANPNAPARRAALQSLRWEREYWDTYMRNEDQERKAVRYIEHNPLKAKLCRKREDWPFSSARLREPDSQSFAVRV
ncbi:MAG: transposase [Verrucomicrobiae bacterium]|nr:transposase [Verrucomicrobiae bacterium]